MKVNKIKKLFWAIEIVPKLGVGNVLYVLYYRMLLRSGILEKKYPVNEIKEYDPVFAECNVSKDFPPEWKNNLLENANKIVKGELPYYSYHWVKQSNPPNWFLNPFNGKECLERKYHWTNISDFNSELGDIKNVWEASRFTWINILARAYKVSGNVIYLNVLNEWISDWITKNPVNQGPNWKCGQEAAFRLFSLINASIILGQSTEPSNTLVEIIRIHLERISSNINYALAQRNNHASSEAAALFIGGNWLLEVDPSNKRQNRVFALRGRKALERLIHSLTYEDGSFAQHSVNYHRLFLDTLILAQYWIRKLDLEEFTTSFYETVNRSIEWLLSMVDESGKCPNLGSNDGTMLLGNHSCDYSDYRPSLQLVSVIFRGYLPFLDGPHNEALFWFGIKKPSDEPSPFLKKTKAYKSGYIIMRGGESWAMLRFPNYKFRPSHNDAFHFDLWMRGSNLLFDSGSYSYNPDIKCIVPDLKSVHSHNTLSFDHEEQMPRLGRFILAKWIKPLFIGDIVQSGDTTGTWQGSYKDANGNFHMRKIEWNNNHWNILDKFSGQARNVEIGFNFKNIDYKFNPDAKTLELPWGKITISNDAELFVRGHKVSHYYWHWDEVNRLVISSRNNSELNTSIQIYK